jgi:hypothetical protein
LAAKQRALVEVLGVLRMFQRRQLRSMIGDQIRF